MFFIHYQRGTTRSTPMMDQCACMPLDQSPCKFIVERLEHSHHLTWSLPEERQWKLNQPNIHFCYQAWLTSIDYKKRPWIISMSFKYGKSACPVMISWDTYDLSPNYSSQRMKCARTQTYHVAGIHQRDSMVMPRQVQFHPHPNLPSFLFQIAQIQQSPTNDDYIGYVSCFLTNRCMNSC